MSLPRDGLDDETQIQRDLQMPAGSLRLSDPGSTGPTARGGRQKGKFHHLHLWAVQVSITSWSQERRVNFPSGTNEATLRSKVCYVKNSPSHNYLEPWKRHIVLPRG